MIDLDSIPRDQIPAAIAALAARLLNEPSPSPAAAVVRPADEEDRLISTREAAALLGRSAKWIYRHVKKLPFARRIGPRDFRFSVKGLRAWEARQRLDRA